MKILLKEKQFTKICLIKNLSPATLSKKLKISQSYISMLTKYNKYKVSPSFILREKIIKLLDSDFDTLFICKHKQK